MNVDIFIWTSTKAPKTARGKYKYVLVAKGGTRSGEGELEKTTGNRLALTCIIRALERMTQPASITIHTECGHVVRNAPYLPTWVLNNWKRKDNRKLQNEDLWKRLSEVQKGHAVAYKLEEVNHIFEDWKDKL